MPFVQGLEKKYDVYRKLASTISSYINRRPAQDKPKEMDSMKAKKSYWSSCGYIKLEEKDTKPKKSRTLRKLGEIAYAMSEFPAMP